MSFDCEVLADSLSMDKVRLTTLEVTFPRIILSEFNTHRVFSRNSASSRAIPVEKMIKRVEDDPFVPLYIGKNQKGMQAGEELDASDRAHVELIWKQSARAAVDTARTLTSYGVHKQVVNRLLEPFSWHTVIVTATEWQNFFNLRCNPQAEPHIEHAAILMRDAMKASKPKKLMTTDWHRPLVPDIEELEKKYSGEAISLISCARCARVSYLTHDGARDPEEDLNLATRLRTSGHMSPFEHVAEQMYRPGGLEDEPIGWSGNLRGWIQYRKRLPNEAVFKS